MDTAMDGRVGHGPIVYRPFTGAGAPPPARTYADASPRIHSPRLGMAAGACPGRHARTDRRRATIRVTWRLRPCRARSASGGSFTRSTRAPLKASVAAAILSVAISLLAQQTRPPPALRAAK